jgi:hypothetical protein
MCDRGNLYLIPPIAYYRTVERIATSPEKHWLLAMTLSGLIKNPPQARRACYNFGAEGGN